MPRRQPRSPGISPLRIKYSPWRWWDLRLTKCPTSWNSAPSSRTSRNSYPIHVSAAADRREPGPAASLGPHAADRNRAAGEPARACQQLCRPTLSSSEAMPAEYCSATKSRSKPRALLPRGRAGRADPSHFARVVMMMAAIPITSARSFLTRKTRIRPGISSASNRHVWSRSKRTFIAGILSTIGPAARRTSASAFPPHPTATARERFGGEGRALCKRDKTWCRKRLALSSSMAPWIEYVSISRIVPSGNAMRCSRMRAGRNSTPNYPRPDQRSAAAHSAAQNPMDGRTD